MRVKNSFLNLLSTWIGQAVLIVLTFFSRKLFVEYLSADLLGLEAVFSNIIAILGLAEFGVASAVTYSLYEPISRNDLVQIKGLVDFLKRIYLGVAGVILVIGLLLTNVIDVFIDKSIDLNTAHIVFIIYVLDSAVGFILSYKAVIAIASQEGFVKTIVHYAVAMVKTVFLILALRLYHDYFIYACIIVVFDISEYLVLYYTVDKRYDVFRQKILGKITPSKSLELRGNIKRIGTSNLLIKLGMSCESILITQLLSLEIAGVYSNYALVLNSLNAISTGFMLSMTSSIGNISIEESTETQIDRFWITMFLNSSLYIVTSVCLFNLLQPFILWWLGEEYLLSDHLVYVIVAEYFLYGIRGQVNVYRSAYGAFEKETRKALLEMLSRISFAILITMKFGVIGVVAGALISDVIVSFYEFKILNKHLCIELKKYYGVLIRYFGVGVLCIVLSLYINKCVKLLDGSFIGMIIAAFICMAVSIGGIVLTFGKRRECLYVLEVVKQRFQRGGV